MSQVIVVRNFHERMGSINIRQLFNPIFFSPVQRHPDNTRQKSARRKTRARTQARRLKQTQSSWMPQLPVVWSPPRQFVQW